MIPETNQTDSGFLHEQLAKHGLNNPASVYRLLFHVGSTVFLVTTLFPIYWLFVIALTPLADISKVGYLPQGFNLSVFVKVFEVVPIHLFIFNSLVIAGVGTVVVLAVGSLAGYAFGRLNFPGQKPLMLLFLIVTYFPGTTFFIPLFRFFSGQLTVAGVTTPNLMNSPFPVALSLSGISLPLAIFILTTFYSQIPDGLEAAARVEGCTRLGALYRVIMPLAAPGVATAGMLTFIFIYNDFFFSFLLTNGRAQSWAPLVHGLYSYRTLKTIPYNLMAAGSIVGLIPVSLIIFVGQKKIISGLTSGALKE